MFLSCPVLSLGELTIHEYKFEYIWSVVSIPIHLDMDRMYRLILCPISVASLKDASFASVNIQQTKPNTSKIEPPMETSILSSS